VDQVGKNNHTAHIDERDDDVAPCLLSLYRENGLALTAETKSNDIEAQRKGLFYAVFKQKWSSASVH
jgi:hypothetical protein